MFQSYVDGNDSNAVSEVDPNTSTHYSKCPNDEVPAFFGVRRIE